MPYMLAFEVGPPKDGVPPAFTLPIEAWGYVLRYIYPDCVGSACTTKFALVCRTFSEAWNSFVANEWTEHFVFSGAIKRDVVEDTDNVIRMLSLSVRLVCAMCYKSTLMSAKRVSGEQPSTPAQISAYLYRICYELCVGKHDTNNYRTQLCYDIFVKLLEEEAAKKVVTPASLRRSNEIILFVFCYLRRNYVPTESKPKLEVVAERLYRKRFHGKKTGQSIRRQVSRLSFGASQIALLDFPSPRTIPPSSTWTLSGAQYAPYAKGRVDHCSCRRVVFCPKNCSRVCKGAFCVWAANDSAAAAQQQYCRGVSEPTTSG